MLGIFGRDRYLDRMFTIFKIIAVQIPLAFRPRIALQAENALLRHQVDILRRYCHLGWTLSAATADAVGAMMAIGSNRE